MTFALRACGRAAWLAALVFAVAACTCHVGNGPGGVAAGPWLPIAKSGSENWIVDGHAYRVASTYYLALPDGVQFTIEYEVPPETKLEGISDDAAFEIASPLMRHVVTKKIYERTQVKKHGEGPKPVAKIGVALVKRQGPLSSGYRVARTLSELRSTIAP